MAQYEGEPDAGAAHRKSAAWIKGVSVPRQPDVPRPRIILAGRAPVCSPCAPAEPGGTPAEALAQVLDARR